MGHLVHVPSFFSDQPLRHVHFAEPACAFAFSVHWNTFPPPGQ
jgi:hypothetical protein